jgi:hypothetical protein
MEARLQPWHLLLLILAGWINRRQQDAVEYLLTENRVLREKLGKNRILLSDDQRRRLAFKGKILGRKMLEQLAGIVNSLPGTGTTAGGGEADSVAGRCWKPNSDPLLPKEKAALSLLQPSKRGAVAGRSSFLTLRGSG